MVKGSKHTPEARAKLSAVRLGHKLSPEHRAKLSAANLGEKNPFYGHRHAPETRAKIAAEKIGAKNGHWKGGRIKSSEDYVWVWSPDHPHANGKGYVYEHRLVMEAHLGRTLLPTEVVHHINGDPSDNRIENLLLFSSKGEHTGHHHHERKKP